MQTLMICIVVSQQMLAGSGLMLLEPVMTAEVSQLHSLVYKGLQCPFSSGIGRLVMSGGHFMKIIYKASLLAYL